MKVGDLVKATPLAKWSVNDSDYTYIGIITKLGFNDERRDPDGVILLNFGDDDGIFRTSDWKFEVISENR